MSHYLEQLLDDETRAECAANDTAMALRRAVPYHTGRVQIGLTYTPQPPRVEGDAVAIQRALLDPRTASPLPPLLQLLGYFWRRL